MTTSKLSTMVSFVVFCVYTFTAANVGRLSAAGQGRKLSTHGGFNIEREVITSEFHTELPIQDNAFVKDWALERANKKELRNDDRALVKHRVFETAVIKELSTDAVSFGKYESFKSEVDNEQQTDVGGSVEDEVYKVAFKQMDDKINVVQMFIKDLEKTVAKQNIVKLEEKINSMQAHIMDLEETVAYQAYVIEKLPVMKEQVTNLEMTLAKQNHLNGVFKDQVLKLETDNTEMKLKLTEMQGEFEMIKKENNQLRTKVDFFFFKTKEEVMASRKWKGSNETIQDNHDAAKFNVYETKTPDSQRFLNSAGQNLGHTNLNSKLRLGNVPVQEFGNGASVMSRGLQGRQVTEPNESIAFSVFVTTDITGLTKGDVIKYDGVMINEGNGYDKTTGMFTAPRSGLYLFSFFIEDYHDQDLWVHLRENNLIRSQAVAEPYEEHQNIMGGNTVLLRVSEGSRVWVSISRGNRVQNNWTSFSGVFLH